MGGDIVLIYICIVCGYVENVPACRLVVGWSWEEVILAAIDDAVSGDQHHRGYEWEKAFLCIFISVLVLTAGYHVDAAVGVYRKKELEQLRESLAANDAPTQTEVTNPLAKQ